MCDCLEQQRAVLAMAAAGREGLAQAALDHAEDPLGLPTLTVAASLRRSLEVMPHSPLKASGRRLGRGAADLGRRNETDVEFRAHEFMGPFGVVAGVHEKRVDRSPSIGFADRFDEMSDVGTRTEPGNGRQNHVRRTVHPQADFGKPPVGHILQAFVAARSATNEVLAYMMGLEAAAVEGRQFRAAAEDFRFGGEANRLIQEPTRGVFLSRRSDAFCSVVQCGTASSSMTDRRSGASMSSYMTPR